MYFDYKIPFLLQGVVTAAASLIKELAEYDPEAYKACVPLAVSRLHKIITVTHGDLLVNTVVVLSYW